MANTLEWGQVFQKELDKAIEVDLLTSWMNKNAGRVQYNGGKEVKVPILQTTGLGNYDRSRVGTGQNPYAKGKVSLEYKTFTMTQDRSATFTLDAMDVNEASFLPTAGNIMGEFQRAHVVPEIDAYRLTEAYKIAQKNQNVKENYTLNPVDILREIKLGIKAIRQKGYNGNIVCHISYDALFTLEESVLNKLSSVTFAGAGINTTVPAIDNVPLLVTPENRLYTEIDLKDGSTEYGYAPTASAKPIHFILIAENAPIPVTRQDLMRIFTPEENQVDGNAWTIDYRRHHDMWILPSAEGLVYACIGDQITTLSGNTKSKSK